MGTSGGVQGVKLPTYLGGSKYHRILKTDRRERESSIVHRKVG